MSIWYELEKQREEVTDDPPSSVADFRNHSSKDHMFGDLYEDAGARGGTRRIPLSYHTKACGWAADYPLMYRRVFVFLNPGPLSVLSLDEYILREFGCWRDTFIKLVAKKRMIPTLVDDREAYPEDVADDIEQLYEEVQKINKEVKPRYVNFVDRFIETRATEDDSIDESRYKRAGSGERIDIDRTVGYWKRERSPWKDLPETEISDLFDGELFGVEVHGNVKNYVTERAVKLRLADETLDIFTDAGDSIKNIQTLAAEYTDGTEEQKRDLVRETYVLWNKFGTPTYYCDLTGSVDMGPTPLKEGYTDNFRRSLKRIGNQFGAEKFRECRTDRIPEIALPIMTSDEADMNDLFAVGPDDLRDLSPRDMYKKLIRRADAHQAYVEHMFDDDNGPMRELTREADSYTELLHIHNEEARGYQRYRNARKIASSFGEGLVTGETVSSVIDVTRQAKQWDSDLLADIAAEVTIPGAGSLLVNAGSATLDVPERIAVAGPERIGVERIQRADAAYGDVWRLPYGQQNRLDQFRWIAEETLENTLKPL